MERVGEVRAGSHAGTARRQRDQLESSSRGPVRPERDRNDRAIAVAIFALTLAYLWIFRRYTSMEPDEGIVLEGAQRILRGEVLYRDFFSYFTPGSYYFLALLFKIFGSSFLVARTALVFFGGFIRLSLTCWRAGCVRAASAIFVAALVTLTTLPYRFEVLHNWDSTLWACLAVYCAVRWLESPRLEVGVRNRIVRRPSLAFLSSRKEPGWHSAWAQAWWRLPYSTGTGAWWQGTHGPGAGNGNGLAFSGDGRLLRRAA